MNISGKIKLIGETKEYGTNGFRKRELVVTTQEQYPQNILVEFVQDRCEILNSYQVGELVKIDINIRGREWTNPKDGQVRFFNSLDAWKVEPLGSAGSSPASADNAETFVAEGDDDLPF